MSIDFAMLRIRYLDMNKRLHKSGDKQYKYRITKIRSLQSSSKIIHATNRTINQNLVSLQVATEQLDFSKSHCVE